MKVYLALAVSIVLAGCSETHVAPQSGQESQRQADDEARQLDDGADDDARETDDEVREADQVAEAAQQPDAWEPEVAVQDAGIPLPDDDDAPDFEPPVPGDASVATECELDSSREPVTLTVPTDYATIQEAIDAAAPLDTVSVLPGTYTEHLQLRTGVRLIGSGAETTILDGLGEGKNLIVFTGAYDVVVSGFTLRNVGMANGCSRPEDVLACSGNWYAAAVYADGHSVVDDSEPCNDASILFSDNIVVGNQIGMMVYFGPYAVVRDNVFTGNRTAFVATAHHATGLVAHNIFYDNEQAMALRASFIDIVDNVFGANGSVLRQMACQEGRLRCNVLWDNEAIGDRFVSGADDNIEADPLIVSSGSSYGLAGGSPAIDRSCAADPEPVVYDSCSYSPAN